MTIASTMKLGLFNLVDQSVTDITASSENAFFPASNIKSPFSSKVFRSEVSSANIVFDFKTTEDVNMIMVRSNLSSGFGFNGALTIEANSIDSWGAPSYSTTITPNSELDLGIKILDSAESYRYWRVSGTGTDYFELSNLYIGSYFEPSKNISLNWKYKLISLDKGITNTYGQPFFTEYGTLREVSGSINLLTVTQMESLLEQVKSVGITKPAWLVLDPNETFSSDSELFAGQFRFTTIPAFSNIAFGYYNTSINLREYK